MDEGVFQNFNKQNHRLLQGIGLDKNRAITMSKQGTR